MPTGGTYLTYMHLLYKFPTSDSIRYLPTYLLKEWTPTYNLDPSTYIFHI